MDYCCGNSMAMGRVACPKPRRLGPSNFNNHMTSRIYMRNDCDAFDSKSGAELLDIIFRKADCGPERCENVSSSPPFFFGSPPRRTPNPIAQDSHFGVDSPNSTCSSPADSARSRVVTYGKKQAAVRVEGFDCERSRVVME